MKQLLVALWMGGCAAAAAQTAWLLGELHDQPDHQRQAAQLVSELAAQGRLQALVLEMAERDRHTRGLPPDAGEAQVREALAWHEPGWPWAVYGPVVMAAVRAGVPVHGGNLPRAELRAATGQAGWDDLVPAAARQRLVDAVRDGHCGLVPEAQLPAMARMQIARDDALAATIAAASHGAPPDAVVLLLAGAVHASRLTGVPLHLPRHAPALTVRTTAFVPAGAIPPAGFDDAREAAAQASRDHCADLRERGMPTITSPASR
ncbi:MAG: ChaN family lipoprotein [Caldimonas sp.]|uniref:ChaN family lipoprotein n=1 Tax=Caldimonas sp. TaxID=2838790 RepID=UPI0039189B7F